MARGLHEPTGWILGLNPGFGGFNYHDPSAVLVRNGEVVVGAEEERFVGEKGAPGIFPARALKYCLTTAGIDLDKIEEVAIGYSPERWRQRLALEAGRAIDSTLGDLIARTREGQFEPLTDVQQVLLEASAALNEAVQRSYAWTDRAARARVQQQLGLSGYGVPIQFVEHHLAHAASAYWPSGFDDALVVVADGIGEICSASAWRVSNRRFECLEEVLVPNSLGYFYAAMTEYLGFRGWEGEGKLMALAPYGGADAAVARKLAPLVSTVDGGYRVDVLIRRCLGHGLSLDLDRCKAVLSSLFEAPARGADEPITDLHKSIAWATQDFLERAVSGFVRKSLSQTGLRNLCVAGGVFFNCKLNMLLRDTEGVERLFAQPVAGDAGLAIGSALHRSMMRPDAPRITGMRTDIGFAEDRALLPELLRRWRLPFTEPPDLIETVAQALSQGAVVMWFHGRAEMGQRALGHRSILADPRDASMRERVNAIKHRAVWRPFGPSVLEHRATEILEGFRVGQTAPHMIEAFRVTESWRARIPAVVHPADSTTRPQTVSRATEPLYFELIARFEELTGVPMLLNTSLNDKGQPIARTAKEAVEFFFTSDADLLVLDGLLLNKRT